jgi:hypothetical protein
MRPVPGSSIIDAGVDIGFDFLGNAPDLGAFEVDDATDVNSIEKNIPDNIHLYQNYPNPFNPTTSIEYQVSRSENVTLKVYDILGSEKKTLVNKIHSPGVYKIKFDASEFPSGVYFYRLQAGEFIQTRKMLLLK